jgi:hypothetical protein
LYCFIDGVVETSVADGGQIERIIGIVTELRAFESVATDVARVPAA